jgi:hypothetical protein
MDAVRTKEWKMFIILKDMDDEKAYTVFVLFHLPLYFLVFYIITQFGMNANLILYFITDIFLIIHALIHFLFRNKKTMDLFQCFQKT